MQSLMRNGEEWSSDGRVEKLVTIQVILRSRAEQVEADSRVYMTSVQEMVVDCRKLRSFPLNFKRTS